MNIFLNKQKTLLSRILISAVFLFIFIAVLNLFQKEIKNTFYLLSSPIEKKIWNAGVNSSIFFMSLLNSGGIAQENRNLKSENQELLSKIAFLQDVARENEAIKEASLNNQDKNFKLILAESTGIDTGRDIILINKGSADGISMNMAVINSQNVLFGKVLKVYKNFSEVMLISNENNVLDVKIQQDDPVKTPIYGVIKGKGNLGVYLDLVPTDSEIKSGDILTTSALEGIFPKDLLVGKIISKNKSDLKPFQTAEIETFYNIKNTDKLFVILNYGD
ncbi:MAG: rod shape-determining protein MreC [Patescibacteria group bacterium]